MFWNNLKLAIRNLRKNRLFVAINLAGLTIAIAGALLLTSYLLQELSYDRFHEHHRSIYRVITGNIGEEKAWAGTPAPLGPALKQAFPEITNYTRLEKIQSVIRIGEKSYHEKRILAVDPSFFDVFSFPVRAGTTGELLSYPEAIVLTESTARKYFGDVDPTGKQVILDDDREYVVKGLIADVPKTSHLQFDALIQFEARNPSHHFSWGAYNFSTYLQAAPNVDEQLLNAKVRDFSFNSPDGYSFSFQGMNLQPLEDIHFQYIRGNYEPVFEEKFIYILGSVAIIILILAIINYINIATALAPIRAKEVGVRKVVGCSRSKLVGQFLAESFVQVIIAVFLALVLLELARSPLESIFEKKLDIDYSHSLIWIGLIGLILAVGMVSGSFPALFMSRYKPLEVLKDRFSGKRKSTFRNVLVTAQFAIAVLLIISTLALLEQVRFLKNRDLGFDKELVVNIPVQTSKMWDRCQELKETFLRNPNVLQAACNTFIPGQTDEHHGVYWEGQSESDGMYVLFVDKDFVSTLNLDLLEGQHEIERFWYEGPRGYILNETAVKEIGWDSAVGKPFSAFSTEKADGTVIGVVKDFNFRSLHHQVDPCVLVLTKRGLIISMKINPREIQATLSAIETTFKSYAPDLPFEYFFSDDEFYQLYDFERRSTRVILFFAFLSIIIASVGLFGLASFSMVQRTKEIGIRKALGASITNIFYLLSREFAVLVILANLVAWPLAWYFTTRWLENFAYRINLDLEIFLLGGAIALTIAVLTISYQAIRTGLSDPVESLRYE